jgi:hypothetical protein
MMGKGISLNCVTFRRMRIIVYTIITLLMFNLGNAQQKDKRQLEVKTNLANIAAGGPSAALEFRLRNNWSSMVSIASGHIDYGDFGGVTRYKTITLEARKYATDNCYFIGPYIKNIGKKVKQEQSYVGGTIPYTIGQDRDFIGNGFSAGASFGIKFSISQKINLELNDQIGFGHYYRMKDKNNNLPSGNYLDARIALWIGF